MLACLCRVTITPEMIGIAKQVAVEAGKIAIELRKRGVNARTKGKETDLVTSGDIASEKKILDVLKSKFPKHNFLSEESGITDNHSQYTWIIDPIDGTSAYFSGLPMWAVSIGLLKDMKPYLGVAFLPDFDELFWAEQNKGAYLNGRRIKVNSEASLAKSIVAFDFGYSDRVEEAKRTYLPLIDKVRYPPILACSVYGMVNVAKGIFGGYVHRALVWDYAATAAMVQEAGGKVTNFEGGEVNWKSPDRWIDVVGTNGLLHSEILSLINK